MIRTLVRAFEHNQVFTEKESWMLFRLAAIAEAVGWSLLLLGIVCQRFIVPGSQAPVMIAGQIHGMLFFGYALAAIGLYPTLGWSRAKGLIALLASVPPYGSLLFELWAGHMRRRSQLSTYSRCMLLVTLKNALAQTNVT